MTILMGIALVIIAILLFELIIFVHEFGHFITAKKSGVLVNEFALGMGPKLFSFKRGETTYSFRLFPIGGYCAMEAEDEESDNPRAFTNVKIWKRMIVIIAGAVMNILLGFLLMFIIVVQQPELPTTTIEDFSPRAFSANCGLEKGDKIVKVNNYSISNSGDFTFAFGTMKCKEFDGKSLQIYKQDCANTLCDLYSSLVKDKAITEEQYNTVIKEITNGTEKINKANTKEEANNILKEYYSLVQKSVDVKGYEVPEIKVKDSRQRFRTDVTVIRNNKTVVLKNVDFYTYIVKGEKEPRVSIDFTVESVNRGFATVIKETFNQTISTVRMVWASLSGLITGQFGFNEVSGPVGMASAITQVASQGLKSSFLDAVNNIINFMMIITVNLGIFNMLPVPALDGGRFFFLLIEWIFKKPVPRKIESIINATGLALLLLFSLIVTLKDIWQLLPF